MKSRINHSEKDDEQYGFFLLFVCCTRFAMQKHQSIKQTGMNLFEICKVNQEREKKRIKQKKIFRQLNEILFFEIDFTFYLFNCNFDFYIHN